MGCVWSDVVLSDRVVACLRILYARDHASTVGGVVGRAVSRKDDESDLTLRESRFDRSRSVTRMLKMATRSLRSPRRTSIIVRSVKHVREEQMDLRGMNNPVSVATQEV